MSEEDALGHHFQDALAEMLLTWLLEAHPKKTLPLGAAPTGHWPLTAVLGSTTLTTLLLLGQMCLSKRKIIIFSNRINFPSKS